MSTTQDMTYKKRAKNTTTLAIHKTIKSESGLYSLLKIINP